MTGRLPTVLAVAALTATAAGFVLGLTAVQVGAACTEHDGSRP